MQKLFAAVRNDEMFRTACLFGGILSLLLLITALPLTFKHIAFWSIFLVALWVTAAAFAGRSMLFGILACGTALVFNPFVPVFASLGWMRVSDIAAAAILLAASQRVDVSRLRLPSGEPPEEPG